jgi:hypothetical protein
VALTAPRLRTLDRGSRRVLDRVSAFLSEDIGSALKGGANVCQHQLVNEVLRLLVTEFVINFGRKDATLIQRAFQSGLLSRIQAVKLIRPPRQKSIVIKTVPLQSCDIL